MTPTDPRAAVARLVQIFNADFRTYTRSQDYREADARSEFIDPLLKALGWDVSNERGVTPARREVVREETQQREDSANKKPDYTLRANGERRLFVEAKKPAVNVLTNMDAILQTRQYGYTDGHPITVLTNFQYVVVYDTTVPVASGDHPETARLYAWPHSELLDSWDEIVRVLGRDAVHAASWRDQFSSTAPQQPLPADEAFIRHFNQWRLDIARDILTTNPGIEQDLLNDAVQQLLNRLIFLRMCEDRGIEGPRALLTAFAGDTDDVSALFVQLNDRYNTELFQSAGTEHDPVLLVRKEVLAAVVENLYAPRSPFSFAVLDANFLGLVYEASLAEHLAVVTADGAPTVELTKKREYEKRDVVTTPQELVDATVGQAVDSLDAALRTPAVLDFATGSGRFLLSAFDRILEREIAHRAEADPASLRNFGDDQWRLPFEDKKRILTEHFFGIDIDYNAVEVARFSLLVRLLEDESTATLPAGRKILPSLTDNVVHGNTLVRELPGATPSERQRTQPLDLAHTGLPEAFDLVIGNPPYMKTEEMKGYDKREFDYLKQHYATAYQQFDKYFAFVEFAVEHLAPGGVLGVVIPNKWMTTVAGQELRRLLTSAVGITRLANFRHVQVFEDKSIYISTLIAQRSAALPFAYSEPKSIDQFTDGTCPTFPIGRGHLPAAAEKPWVLPGTDVEHRVLAAIDACAVRLDQIVKPLNGVQTSANRVYILKNPRISGDHVEFEQRGQTWKVELAVTRPYVDNSAGVRSHHLLAADARIIYPYRTTSNAANTSGVEVIPESVMQQHYPLAHQYLTAHRATLDRRDVSAEERKKAFYVYGRTQAVGYCTRVPKIVYSVNQTGYKYGLDHDTGIVFQSGGTAGEAALYPDTSGYSLDFVLALLGQRPIEFFLRKRGSPFRGGYFARGTDVIGNVPVPRLDLDDPQDRAFHDDVARDMVALRDLHAQTGSTAQRRMTQHLASIAATERRITGQFLDRWGLTAEEVGDLRL